MKLTNPNALVAYSAITSLIKQGNVLPGLTSLRSARNLRMLEPFAVPYEQKRIELIQRLGVQDAVTGNWSVDPSSPAWAEFSAEFDPMAAEEHEVALYTIPLADVLKGYSVDAEGKVRLLNFSGAELGALDHLGIISDGENAAPATPAKQGRKRRPR